MLFREIIDVYSVESYETRKYTVGQNAFQLREWVFSAELIEFSARYLYSWRVE
jgi:hypothetical protein